MQIKYQKAQNQDLKEIINLLFEDELGKNREFLDQENFKNYEKAFQEISEDKNQFLVVGKFGDEIISCCQLTMIQYLTHGGSKRLQIEAVRVKEKYRGQKIGQSLIEFAFDFGRKNNCRIVQLTTDKVRDGAVRFYEKLGFIASHEGMKKEI